MKPAAAKSGSGFRSFALSAAVLALCPALTGCLVHTYHVAQPKAPAGVKNATTEQLVQMVNAQSRTITTLKATVSFQVSVGGVKKGKETNYPTFSGYIRLRAPEMLRVLGLLPIVRTQAFDLASDGTHFTLVIPHNNKAYVGLNAVTSPAASPLENLRPNIFFDTLILRPIGPDDLVYLTTANPTSTDPRTHQLTSQPEYDLTILRRKPNSPELVPERRIHFDRTTLLPNGVDIYDAHGDIQTQATYGTYSAYGDAHYPATITINRPIDEYRIVVSVINLTLNQPLPDTQFQLKIPDGYTVQQMN